MRIHCQPLELTLKQPFRISHSEFHKLEHFLLIVEEQGITAYGEVVPIAFFNETYGTAREQISFVMERYSLASIERLEQIRQFVQWMKKRRLLKCVICGFEMLLLDYVGKLQEKPVWSLLELQNPGVRQSAVTLPICEDHALSRLEHVQSAVVKLKLGGSADLEMLRYIQGQEGASPGYILDMNQGWTLEQLDMHRRLLEHPSILLIEEPLSIQDEASARRLRGLQLDAPIFLDESISSMEDAKRHGPYVDGMNIKVIKMGGLLESMEIVRSFPRLSFLLGCFLESSLSISYAFQISGLFAYVDLDGASFISNDPFTGLQFDNGRIHLPEHYAGLGVSYA